MIPPYVFLSGLAILNIIVFIWEIQHKRRNSVDEIKWLKYWCNAGIAHKNFKGYTLTVCRHGKWKSGGQIRRVICSVSRMNCMLVCTVQNLVMVDGVTRGSSNTKQHGRVAVLDERSGITDVCLNATLRKPVIKNGDSFEFETVDGSQVTITLLRPF